MKIGIESNATQSIITDEWKSKTRLPIYQIKSSWINDKWSRCQNLSVKFETGRIYLNPKFVRLKDELLEFPRARHEDNLDSLSFAIQAWEHGKKSTDWNKMAEVMNSRRNIRKL
jgi:phage terminase large subunit-like protein